MEEFLTMSMKEDITLNGWRYSSIIPIIIRFRLITTKKESYAKKLLERVLDKRLREKMKICDEWFDFVNGRESINAVFAMRRAMEK